MKKACRTAKRAWLKEKAKSAEDAFRVNNAKVTYKNIKEPASHDRMVALESKEPMVV